MANTDQIRQALLSRPFRPFTIHLADGRTCFVKHPDFVTIPPVPRARSIIYWTDDEMQLIDLGLIVSIIVPIVDQAQKAPSEP